jgi:hypothetical protein
VIITPIYDSFALAAPASFRAGIQTAINMLDAKFTANITVAISIESAPGILSGPMESRP